MDQTIFKEKIKDLILLQNRSFSKIYKFKYDGKLYIYKQIWPNEKVSIQLINRSYDNYFRLKNKEGLVKVCDFWIENDVGCIIMEYLIGYNQIVHYKGNKLHLIKKITKIIVNLIDQNFIDYDIDITNFLMNRDGDIKLIDLDKIMRVKFLKEHYAEWFSSRMIRLLCWLNENKR